MVIEIPLSKQGKHKGKYVAIVDDCDADLVEFNWEAEINPTNTYVCCIGTNKDRMHRVILERMIAPRVLQKHEYPDHINGDGLDNRRENLRVATHSQNMSNRKVQSNNTSGVRGVTWNKNKGKWQVYIKHNKKQYTIGFFSSLDEAKLARKEAEALFHGEFARKDYSSK